MLSFWKTSIQILLKKFGKKLKPQWKQKPIIRYQLEISCSVARSLPTMSPLMLEISLILWVAKMFRICVKCGMEIFFGLVGILLWLMVLVRNLSRVWVLLWQELKESILTISIVVVWIVGITPICTMSLQL